MERTGFKKESELTTEKANVSLSLRGQRDLEAGEIEGTP